MTEHPDTPPVSAVFALVPVVFLLSGLSLAVYLFGDSASAGPNQIVLILTTCLIVMMASMRGVRWKILEEGMVHGISLGIGAIMILFAVGMLIGSWILAGTVPTMIYYGIKILDPGFFYAAAAGLCAIVAISIGSSWTVAGTMGIGLMGIAASFDLSPAITAGAIISGAYFGDKMSPMSDTTNLAAACANVDLFAHIRHMLWTTTPSIVIALAVFTVLGSAQGETPDQVATLTAVLQSQFNLGVHLLLPLATMLYLAYKRFPAFPAIIACTLLASVMAVLFQYPQVQALADSGDNLSPALTTLKATLISLFDGYSADTGNAFLDRLLSKGGMSSMLTTVWLIICALALGGVMERLGILEYLLNLMLRGVKSTGSLVATTVSTCIGTNVLASEQYMAVALPGRMYRNAYTSRGLSPLNLSRTLEDSATITSPLVPWNTCGAYMTATLGISTLAYAPYAVFNIVCPIVAIVYAYLNIGQKPLETDLSMKAEATA